MVAAVLEELILVLAVVMVVKAEIQFIFHLVINMPLVAVVELADILVMVVVVVKAELVVQIKEELALAAVAVAAVFRVV
jgi:hypothetical protein